ncbi:hypothetical protein NQ315_014360 [Exocentrus adspersus]|uniref:Uncharacterized protein n=1 Tax=Exocentrus adspersus TaxID=1586481 RepID=A0AAV8V6I7_9CUCU|nr:hypothetical protein NQ315_014360 [Exocentrus adspersus]
MYYLKKFVDRHIIHTTKLYSCQKIIGAYPNEAEDWQSTYLNELVIPILGDCYQLYDKDITYPCRRDPDPEHQACIQRIPLDNNKKCLGFVTPTNETVLLSCISKVRFDNCYEVYDSDGNEDVICQQVFEGYGIGITTPDNFTILFYNYFCRTASNLMERQVHSNFVHNYMFDVNSRSCYKVYNSEEEVTPYNCLSQEIDNACVFTVSDGCVGLMTQNNEVLILDCPDKSKIPSQPNCFYMYTPDNQIHTVCQKIVEERCVGIVTPSNLTVLLDCFFCSDSIKITYYNDEKRRNYRYFVKNYIEDEYLGRNAYLHSPSFEVFNTKQFTDCSNLIQISASWIPKTSCLGITLESNETIILDCLIQNEKQEEPGCFQLITTGNERVPVCAKILNEACVGLTTPNHWSVVLSCYPESEEHYCRFNRLALKNGEILFFLYRRLMDFVDNMDNTYTFRVGDSYNMSNNNDRPPNDIRTYHVQKLDDLFDCLGLRTETELIILKCPSIIMKTNGCFMVLRIGDGSNINKECGEVLKSLARLPRCPGHTRIPGIETADQLARLGSEEACQGLEPILGISRGSINGARSKWTYQRLGISWRMNTGCRQAHNFLDGPDMSKTVWLLNLDRGTLTQVVEILTGHCRLRRHIHLISIEASPLRPEYGKRKDVPVHRLGHSFRDFWETTT